MQEALLVGLLIYCGWNWAYHAALRKQKKIWFEAGFRAGVEAAKHHAADSSSLAPNAKTP